MKVTIEVMRSSLTLLIVALLGVSLPSHAQTRKGFVYDTTAGVLPPFVPRAEFNRLLEPKGQVWFGLGQSTPRPHRQFCSVLPRHCPPPLVMYYAGVRGMTARKWRRMADSLNTLPPSAHLQLGLSMTTDGKPEEVYARQVANGQFDRQLDTLYDFLAGLGRSTLLRIGYEFNGEWNGYPEQDYIDAYRHVAKRLQPLRDRGLVAYVWCYAVDGKRPEFMTYHPGAQYIDWWAIDLFGVNHFTEARTRAFLDSSMAARCPLMIGECSPRRVGTRPADRAWRVWFGPLFAMVRQQPNLKAVSYINYDWQHTFLPDWGDARLEISPELTARVGAELDQHWYSTGQGRTAEPKAKAPSKTPRRKP